MSEEKKICVDCSQPAMTGLIRCVAHAESHGKIGDSQKETLRQIKRTAEMSAEIMRDRERTGQWEGAERVARQFDRLAKLAAKLEIPSQRVPVDPMDPIFARLFPGIVGWLRDDGLFIKNPPPCMPSSTWTPLVKDGCEKQTAKDAARYRWLRNDNAYAPEEESIRGGEELDKLCDEGIAKSPQCARSESPFSTSEAWKLLSDFHIAMHDFEALGQEYLRPMIDARDKCYAAMGAVKKSPAGS